MNASSVPCRKSEQKSFSPGVATGRANATAQSSSPGASDRVGITISSSAFAAYEVCTLAPRTTIPSSLRSTIRR